MKSTIKNWHYVQLRDICELRYGKSLPEAKRNGGKIPVYGSNGVVGCHDEALTNGPTIIVGRKGSLGEVTYCPTECWPIDTTYYIDSSVTDADLGWLVYCLKQLRLTEMNKAAAVPGLNRDDAYAKSLLLPPLKEQKRIAAVLDKAAAIRCKRAEALRLADDFLKSAFLYLVGPGAMGYERWQEMSISEIVATHRGAIRTGPFGSNLRHAEFVDEGIAVLGIDNAVNNRFEWAQRRFITEEKYEELKQYTVFPGDVIITIMGTTGRSAVVPEDIPTAISTKHLATITPNRKLVYPQFIAFSVRDNREVLHQIAMSSKGAIMDGLNLTIIKGLRLRVPPLDVQAQFEALVKRTEQARSRLLRLQDEAIKLFGSLVQRAFRGEL